MDEKDNPIGHIDSVEETEEGINVQGTLNDWGKYRLGHGITYLPPEKPGPDGEFYKGLFWGILISIPMWALIIFVFVLLGLWLFLILFFFGISCSVMV